ncbi:sulfate transporter 1.3 [Artemisia annua]|uniref:Sulfate transporter 1.3 n=1 Tax=Artemisia annua TaxID=35608 RepID=A0A2U1L4R0_ARTAN|nr:sulfate transporter 1.3 [Artemisia annua]
MVYGAGGFGLMDMISQRNFDGGCHDLGNTSKVCLVMLIKTADVMVAGKQIIWKIDKLDFVACMGAFVGVVFRSVEIGLLIAVAISFAKILLQVTRSRTAILGKIPQTSVYRNIGQYPEATKVPSVLIDQHTVVSSKVYKGERSLTLECWLLAIFDLSSIPLAPRLSICSRYSQLKGAIMHSGYTTRWGM